MPRITDNSDKPYAEIGTLLRNLRLRRGMSQFDLATTVGINNSYLSRIENGERRPSPKILKKFAEALQFSYDELVVKSGILSADFVKATPGQSSQQAPTTEMLRQLIETMQSRGAGSGENQPRRAAPVYDSVPAGFFKEANVIETYADVPKLILSEDELAGDPRAFALVVKGDSMVEAGILDGDILIVSPSSPVNSGDIAVVLVEGSETTVKRVYFEDGALLLQPANSNYRPQLISYPGAAEIIGRVVFVRRRLD
jgi:SOS-response transcriptional repressor LexA